MSIFRIWGGLAALLIAIFAGGPALAQPDESFAAWVAGFRAEALAAGITAETFDTSFDGVEVNATVLERDAFQPEFSRPLWEYLDSAVSETRIANGRAALANNASLLAQIEARYGVDRHVVVAVWGLESAYGEVLGTFNIIQALATLAYDGRRASWARGELINALRIIQEGAMSADHMTGSWAGAMGHTQFIPSSYLEYGVDYDGDGRRDLVGNHHDALASTANYLSRFGWVEGWRWGREVILPDDFDYALTGTDREEPISYWRSLGVLKANGAPLPNDPTDSSIIIPAGAGGPAFIVYRNFAVIKRYNNSTAYALAVGHLADRIRGEGGIVQSWPRDERALSRTEREELQSLLNENGYDAGVVDGIIGAQTSNAVRAFQRDRGLPQDGFASSSVLEALRGL